MLFMRVGAGPHNYVHVHVLRFFTLYYMYIYIYIYIYMYVLYILLFNLDQHNYYDIVNVYLMCMHVHVCNILYIIIIYTCTYNQ